MKGQVNQMAATNLETKPETKFVRIKVPARFRQMDLSEKIEYVANELRILESGFPEEIGELKRNTSLVRIEPSEFVYSIEYVPVLEDEY